LDDLKNLEEQLAGMEIKGDDDEDEEFEDEEETEVKAAAAKGKPSVTKPDGKKK